MILSYGSMAVLLDRLLCCCDYFSPATATMATTAAVALDLNAHLFIALYVRINVIVFVSERGCCVIPIDGGPCKCKTFFRCQPKLDTRMFWSECCSICRESFPFFNMSA